METLTHFKTYPVKFSRIKHVDFDNLEFGKHVADHMLVCDYNNDQWQEATIVPYTNLSMSPTCLALHYGQTVFEGMKAFRMKDGRINIFRIDKHYDRLARSLGRMCMPVIPREVFTEGMMQLVKLDEQWVPGTEGSALYIRPFMYASEEKFGIKISNSYRFIIFSGPVPLLYQSSIKVKVETHFIRAARGGAGAAKCGGNYGAAYYPTQLAKQQGYDQLLWTDGKENKYIEESGMMNACFVIDGKLVTPPLSDSILDGVTRDSLLKLAVDLGMVVEERQVSVDELVDSFHKNKITEAFGAGTAAVVLPIDTIGINGVDYRLPAYNNDCMMFRLQKELEAIRSGSIADRFQWNFIV